MRILITGSGGLLGGRLCDLLGSDHTVTGLVRNQSAPGGIAVVKGDLGDEAAAEGIVRTTRPDVVIHSAALADAEICEREPAKADRDNVIATRNLARAVARYGARLIVISTDLVFGGENAPVNETSPTGPLMEYGRSKLRAETAAREEKEDVVILRVGLVCGRGHGARLSASEGLARRLRAGESVTLYEDEWRTPVDPQSVAAAAKNVVAKDTTHGVFHIAGAERLTRVELGERVAATLGLDPTLIRRAKQASHQGAPRPRDVSLDISKAQRDLDFTPRSLDAALREGRD